MSVTLAAGDREQESALGRTGESGRQTGLWQPAMRLGRELQQRLRCPACGARLELMREDFVCIDSGCQKRFPVVDGAPVLIDEARSVFRQRQALRRRPPAAPKRLHALLRRLRSGLPALSGNPVAARNLERFWWLLAGSNPRPRLLVIGGAWVGAGMDELLSDRQIECVESDVWLSGRIHLVCDSHQIPFEEGIFDGVVVQAVLEHVADPERCVREIHRVLKRGGLVYAETAFLQQVHAGRHDFARFTPVGHRRLFRGFEQIAAGAAAGPAVALAWAWQHFLLSFTTSRAGRVAATVSAAFTAFWLKYLDRFLLETPAALDGASACFFLGARQEYELTDQEVIAAYPGAQNDVV